MIFIASFLIGVFFISSWSIFYYLIKPNTFFLTINQQSISRWNVLLYWFLLNLIIFILLCLFVPIDQEESPLTAIFFGMGVALIGLFYCSKNKINLNRKKKVSDQLKIDRQEIRQEFKPKKEDVPVMPKVSVKATVTYEESKPKIIDSDISAIEQVIDHVEHDVEIDPSVIFRYELDYKDRFGNITTRFIDVIAIQKELGNNRWYFVADTPEGERTFKSERVRELRDSWTGEVFRTSKAVRDHLVKNYPETDNAFDD
ncbi:hypothetical protein [Acinetobacter baumannii]|uniref:hypothetical protein n=1 Tax=Acinetobacter baumannii TaxID=470 RepID=UPI001CDC2B19|nr:hypothetical protein [Acinetobacter baumannii]MCA4259954.1 hypothetical protein [Acinetobacter baumannii]